MRKELTPLSSVACRRHPLPREGGSGSSSCSTGDTKGKYVTLGSFLRKELGEALRNTENMRKELTLFLRRLTECTANMSCTRELDL